MRLSTLVPLAIAMPVLSPAQSPVTSPASSWFRDGTAVYDQARQRLVVGTQREVWEWDGSSWALSSARLPVNAVRAIYHPQRRTTLWFTLSGHLHEFDGHAFVDLGVAPGTISVGIAFDSHRNRLVSFSFATNLRPVVYEWDGQSWSFGAQGSSMALPKGIAYDETRQRCVAAVTLVGGGHATMEWDGQSLTQVSSSVSERHAIGYDPATQMVLSFDQGIEGWNGSQWVVLQSTAPAPSQYATPDPLHGRLIAVANDFESGFGFWSWDGTSCSFLQRGPHPGWLGYGFTFDESRGVAVLLSDAEGSTRMGHSEWDGVRWHDRAGAATPLRRQAHAQVYDPVRGETLIFGGVVNNIPSQELWSFDGVQWTLRANGGPSPRSAAAMAFDSARGEVALFGGIAANGSFLTDLWRWNGGNWVQVQANHPLTSHGGPIAFDPLRNVLVMVDAAGLTYEFGAAGWVLASAVPTSVASMTFDPRRGVIAAGGDQVTPRREWNGIQWLPVDGAFGSLAYDSVRNGMLVQTNSYLLVESTQPASAVSVGNGCGGSTISTSLTAFGLPRPGNQDLHVDLRAEAAQRPAVLGYGFAGPATPIGNGCTLQIGATLGSSIWYTDAAGCWHSPLPIPDVLALRGLSFVVQGAVLDPASPAGIGLSNGLALTIGN